MGWVGLGWGGVGVRRDHGSDAKWGERERRPRPHSSFPAQTLPSYLCTWRECVGGPGWAGVGGWVGLTWPGRENTQTTWAKAWAMALGRGPRPRIPQGQSQAQSPSCCAIGRENQKGHGLPLGLVTRPLFVSRRLARLALGIFGSRPMREAPFFLGESGSPPSQPQAQDADASGCRSTAPRLVFDFSSPLPRGQPLVGPVAFSAIDAHRQRPHRKMGHVGRVHTGWVLGVCTGRWKGGGGGVACTRRRC